MSALFPSPQVLQHALSSTLRNRAQKPKTNERSNYQAPKDPWVAYSITDDAKSKAKKLSAEAQAEFDKASQTAQAKAGTIELYSGKYYAACTVGGILACGTTHTAGNFQAWGLIFRQDGLRGIFTGWSPTFVGYSAQGAFKYGWYEFFKKTYADVTGPEIAAKYKTGLYLAASASAEFLADIALCPLEAVKVRMQTTMPPAYSGTMDGIRKITAAEGYGGLYKGLYPLWGRQIPYTMMKFASFETIVEMIYARLPGQKSDYSKPAQIGVSFTGGYLAGILCAIVSHPADVLVSKINANRAAGEGFGAAVSRNYREIGFMGLWNGLPVRIIMVGTLTGMQWCIYDYFKLFMGLPTTGGGPPAAEKK